jgi:RNase H-fold protein (predicted Holliday junction resolvase)
MLCIPQLLAIDHGTARIGLAVCDASWSVVAAGKVIDGMRSISELRAQILALCNEHEVGGVVVGWPLHPVSGKPTPQCVKVAAFMEALRLDALPKTLWDERFSSQLARHEAIHEPLMDLEAADGRARGVAELRGHRRALRSARALASDWRLAAVDDVAAKVVLESFLLRQTERHHGRRPGATA